MSRILKIVLRGLLSLALSLFISCAGGAGGGGSGSAGDEATSLSIQLPTTIENSVRALSRSSTTQYEKIDSNFETFTVTITSSSYKATKSCGRGETLTFPNIPVGHYDVVALAKKADGAVTAKGTATVDVEADVTKTVTITLTRLYYHTVTFQSKRIDNNPNSGSYMQPVDYTFTQEVSDGYKVSKPSNPTLEGATFGGWYKGTVDNDGKLTLETDAYDFDSTVSEDFAIYAKWIYVSFTGTVAEFLTATLDTTTSGTRTITITDVSDANFSSFTARLNEFSSLRSFNLTLQGTLTEIPANAFKTSNVSCAGYLKTVRLPNTVTKIGNQAFYNSRNLELIFPTGLEEIGDRAINASLMGSPRRIASLTNLRKIGDLAFMSIGSLSIGADPMTIPASVTEIYSTSFEKSKPFSITFAGNNLWTKYQGDTMIEENVVLGSDDVKYSSGATVYRYVRAAP